MIRGPLSGTELVSGWMALHIFIVKDDFGLEQS
jgi:hypothetical protein